MKQIKLIFAAMLLIVMAACSGASSASYNPKMCEELKEKISNDQTLSESDYNDITDQMAACFKILVEKQKELGDDKAAYREYMTSEEGSKVAEYALGFALTLQKDEDKLSPDNVKKLVEVKKMMEDLEK